MNSFGRLYRVTTFGESHGPAIGGVIDGFPPGIELDLEAVQRELDRRKPGSGTGASKRREEDRVQFLSGIFEGKSLGTPIGFIIPNTDARSDDYARMRDIYRPSHADFTYQAKYGIRDYRGGGRASARETACRVVAGALARQALRREGISVSAFTSQIGQVSIDSSTRLSFSEVYRNPMRCPSMELAERMEEYLKSVAAEGDTVGGCVQCVVQGLPVGLGEPVYGKLQSMLAAAMLSIPAVKGFEYGAGFGITCMKGSQATDLFTVSAEGSISTRTNWSGGIQGGISNGLPVIMNVGFKPAATMMRDMECIDRFGSEVKLNPGGRHDVCVVPRAVPVVEAMACCVILDAYMLDATMLTPPDPLN